MKYIKQEKSHTCGVACVRMTLAAQGLLDVDEDTLEQIMGTSYETGTGYDSMISAADKFGLDQIHGGGTIDFIEKLTKGGWTVVLAYTIFGAPHYSIFLDCDQDHIYLCDPLFSERVCHRKDTFMWEIFDIGFETKNWYIAYKIK